MCAANVEKEIVKLGPEVSKIYFDAKETLTTAQDSRKPRAKELLAVPDRSTLKGKRDYVVLALLVGCALRRNELAELDVETIQ
jgi:hypothetical protein